MSGVFVYLCVLAGLFGFFVVLGLVWKLADWLAYRFGYWAALLLWIAILAVPLSILFSHIQR